MLRLRTSQRPIQRCVWGLTAAQSDTATTALIRYCQSQSHCHSESEVKAQAVLVSCARLERHMVKDFVEGPSCAAEQHSCGTLYPDFAPKQ